MWILNAPQLLLASASPRRLDLLRQLHIPVDQLILPQQADDEPRLTDEPVIDYVMRTSADKNLRAQEHVAKNMPMLEDMPILSGDTTVAIDQTILGKPQDDKDAREILHRLSGQTHDVFSAVTVFWKGQSRHALSHSRVTFTELSEMQIRAYVASGEAHGKAGAYGIQGSAAGFVSRIEGSYTGIVGLPLFETTQTLHMMGLLRVPDQD